MPAERERWKKNGSLACGVLDSWRGRGSAAEVVKEDKRKRIEME